MKVKLNNNIYKEFKKLNEIGPAPTDAKEKKDSSAQNAFNAAYEFQCKQMYIDSLKRDALAVDIKMPSDIHGYFMIDKCPEDLGNLMRELNLKGKFMNIHNMVEDPQKTFNHATDYADTCFSGFTDKIDVANKEYQKNTANTFVDKSASAAVESYYYKGIYGQLNEVLEPSVQLVHWTALKWGTALGLSTGDLAGAITQGAMATIGAFGVQMSLTAGVIALTGYFTQKAFGSVDPTSSLTTPTNTDDLADSNISSDEIISDADGNLFQPATSDKFWQGDNAIEAINAYINNLKDSVGNVLSQASPNPDKYSEFIKRINLYITTEDEALGKYFKSNNEIVNAAQEKIKEEIKLRRERDSQRKDDQINFSTALSKLLLTSDNYEEAIKYNKKILDHFNLNVKKTAITNEYEEAIDKGSFKDVLNVYKRLTSAKGKPMDDYKENASLDNNQFNNVLNEADSAENDKPQVDVTYHYNYIKNELMQFMSECFPIGKGNEIPGWNDAKGLMEGMLTNHSQAIKDRITVICNSFNDGKEEKVNDKIRSFFVHHPMQAKSLNELWSRHETELKMRMNRRLKQMADMYNTERTLGWTVKLCKTIVPEVFARLFAYRYLLSILKHEGYYNYTPEAYKDDEKTWDNSKDQILAERENITKWILLHHSGDYTVDGKPCISITDNGFELTSYMEFASLLLMQLEKAKGNDKFNVFDPKTIEAAHYIAGSNTHEKVNDYIKVLSDNLKPKTSKDSRNLLKETEKFRLPEEYKALKEDIKKAADKIKALIKNAKSDNINMTQSLVLLSTKKDIFTKYIENYESVKQIMADYVGIQDQKDDKIKLLQEKLTSILGDFTYIPNAIQNSVDFQELIKIDDNLKYDLYEFVASFYNGFIGNTVLNTSNPIKSNISTFTDYNTVKGIKFVCDITVKYIELLTSGILTLGQVMSQNDMELKLIHRDMHSFISIDENQDKELHACLKDIYVACGGKVGNEFDDAYNRINEVLKQKSKDNANRQSGQKVNDSIVDRFIKLLENSQNIVNAANDPNNNAVIISMQNIFKTDFPASPYTFKGFDDIKLSTNVNECKNVNTLLKFAEMNTEKFTFTSDDIEQQTLFMDNFKTYVRYLIQYVLCSVNTESNTDVFNTIIKDLHDIIINYNSNTLDNVTVYVRNAYVHSYGSGEDFDKAYNTANILNVSSFISDIINYLKNPNNIIDAENPSALLKINKIADKLDIPKFVKDCKYTTIYELAENEKWKDNEQPKYVLDETMQDAAKFWEHFKDYIQKIIAVSLQNAYETSKDLKDLKEKLIFGMTIPEYSKYVFSSIDRAVDKLMPIINDPNNPKHVPAKAAKDNIDKKLKQMNQDYIDAYHRSFTLDPLDPFAITTAYDSLKDSGNDITLGKYKSMQVFNGVFNIFNIFQNIDLSKINKINDLYNYFNTLEFNNCIFKDLSDVDKKTVILHILMAIKDLNMSDVFKKFNVVITQSF